MCVPNRAYLNSYEQENRLILVGVGGGGSSAVGRMQEGWTDGPPCAVVDTDIQSLGAHPEEIQMGIGRSLTQGLGSGGLTDVGRLAAENDVDGLRRLLQGHHIVVLNVALGGGTGGGSGPVVARIAHEMGALVICFATLPFRFEGEARQRQALLGLRDVRNFADVVIVQPNDLLLETAGDRAIPEAFLAADTMLGVGIRALWRLLTRPGLIHIGFADIRQVVMNTGKTCAFGYGMGQGVSRVTNALADLRDSPLLNHGLHLAKSASLLVQVVSGPDITLVEIEQVMEGIRESARENAHISLGVTIEPDWNRRLAITLLCSEEWPIEPELPSSAQDVSSNQTHEAAATIEDEKMGDEKGKQRSSRRVARRRKLQKKMAPGSNEKGRFQGVEPTFYEGQDLDIPTFLRKGVKLIGDR